MNLRLRENKREKERSLSENGCVGERERRWRVLENGENGDRL